MAKEIGIDFGTTNTVVSYVNKKGFLTPMKIDSEKVIPSVVFYRSEHEYLIGKKAEKMLMRFPEACVREFKVHIAEEQKFTVKAENGDEFNIRYKDVAENFLSRIIDKAQGRINKEFQDSLGNVVITVPAKFDESQKTTIKKSARNAGFEKVKLAAEPTAAAVCYQMDSGEFGNTILVYDFGGGTFDVSVIRRDGTEDEPVYKELATDGDKKLGGRDIDDLLVKYFLERIERDFELEMPFDPDEFDEECGISQLEYFQNMIAIRQEAIRAKEAMSEEDSFDCEINLFLKTGENDFWETKLLKEDFNKLIKPLIDRTIRITGNVLKEANERCGVNHIDEIVLAGGSSKLSLVAELMRDTFNQGRVVMADDPETLISRGAAYLANTELDRVTESITNVQYGIADSAGVNYMQFKPVIMENEKLPVSRTCYRYLRESGQKRLEVPYYIRDIKNYPKATRTDQDGIEWIGSLIIRNLPDNLAIDNVRIAITFTMEIDGTLSVSVDVQDLKGNTICNDTDVIRKSDSDNLE